MISAESDSTGTKAGAGPPADAALLRDRAVRGGVMSLINQTVRMATSLGTTLIVAVYLGPEEFGLFAVAVSIQVFADILRDSGLANSLIQKKDITDAHLNSVLWVGVALSTALAGALALFAGSVAAFYERPQLQPILWVMTVPIIAQAFASVQEAQLRKQLSFGRLMLAESGSAVIASVAAIVAVVMGAGVWALVLRMVVFSLLLAVFCWSLSSWRPRWTFSLAALRSLWVFGGFLFLTALMMYGISRLDSLIIGKMIGVAAAGTFFMARHLTLGTMQQIVGAVARVMFPVFSLIQNDDALLRSAFMTGTRCLATLVFPIIAGMVALAPEAVAVVLPAKWEPAIVLIQIIALHGILQCVNSPAGQLLYARGRSRLQFVYSLVIGSAIIASFVVGAYWGVIGVAVSWTIVAFTMGPAVLWYAAREIRLSIPRFVVHLLPPTAAALGAAGVARLAVWGWMRSGQPLGYGLLIGATLAGAVGYLGLCRWLLPDTLAQLRRDLSPARLWGRSRADPPSPG
ncbi:MAG: lipopolysaccharide biosynthesis protein [Phycisphaerae bacterium]